MPTARSASAIGVLGSAVHVVGGYEAGNCGYLDKHEAYDPATNTWSTKAPLPWSPEQPGGAVVQGQLFVIGGLVNGPNDVAAKLTCDIRASQKVASYDPGTNAWTPRALLPAGRGAFGTGVIDGIIYVVGGSAGGRSGPVVNTVYAYDPANNTWTIKAPMPTARMGLAAAVVDGILYAIGGNDGFARSAAVEAYNPSADTWSTRAPLPVGREDLSAAAVGGRVYVMGGLKAGSGDTHEVLIYDPATDTWGFAAPMPAVRYRTASAVSQGVIYTVGGINIAIRTDRNEAFTPPGGVATLAVTPSTLDFGPQSRNTTSRPRIVTLSNIGPGPLTIQAATISGPFALSGTCTTIAAGASCPLSVTFTPTTDGSLTGSLAIDSSVGTASVPLAGVGERSLVVHYYQSILRRAPEPSGKAYWESEAARVSSLGANVNEVWFAMAQQFYFSPEYAAFNRDNAAFVTDLYNTFFNRSPDSGGLAYWVGNLDSGMPREVALAGFIFSAEFRAFTEAVFGNAAVRAELDMVMDFYRGLLGRLPDDGGFKPWVDRFRVAQCQGGNAVSAEVEMISSAFALSGEYFARGRTTAQYVGDVYNAFLRRGGDLEGVKFWINQIDSGARSRENVRQAFVASPEFQVRVNQVVGQGCLR